MLDVSEERAIRKHERAFVLGAARAHVADARSAMLKAQDALTKGKDPSSAKADLDRCIARLNAFLGLGEASEGQRAA